MKRAFPAGFYIEFLKEAKLNKAIGEIYHDILVLAMKLREQSYIFCFRASNYCVNLTGTAAISVALLTSAIGPFIYKWLPVHSLSFVTRCAILFLLDMSFMSLLALIDKAVEWDQSGGAVFGIIFFVRSVQGLIIGVIVTVVQVNKKIGMILIN